VAAASIPLHLLQKGYVLGHALDTTEAAFSECNAQWVFIMGINAQLLFADFLLQRNFL